MTISSNAKTNQTFRQTNIQKINNTFKNITNKSEQNFA